MNFLAIREGKVTVQIGLRTCCADRTTRQNARFWHFARIPRHDGASSAGPMKVYYENPPPIRRHVFRYAKCARHTFMGGGASAAGRMKVYFESSAAD